MVIASYEYGHGIIDRPERMGALDSDKENQTIEERMERKLELRLKGKSTLGLYSNEDQDEQIDKMQMLAANRSALSAMQKAQYMNTEWTVASHKKIIGKPIVAVKRLIRKGVRWYVRPPMIQQSEFNRNALDVIRNLQMLIETQQETIQKLQEEQAELVRQWNEQMAQQEQVLSRQRRWMEQYQPYLQILIEWKDNAGERLERLERACAKKNDNGE